MPAFKEIEFKLSTPIKTHDGEIAVLKLKQPTARSFIRHGMPFELYSKTGKDGNAEDHMEFNSKTMMLFVADMTGVDDLILESVPGCDVLPLFMQVASILGNRNALST